MAHHRRYKGLVSFPGLGLFGKGKKREDQVLSFFSGLAVTAVADLALSKIPQFMNLGLGVATTDAVLLGAGAAVGSMVSNRVAKTKGSLLPAAIGSGAYLAVQYLVTSLGVAPSSSATAIAQAAPAAATAGYGFSPRVLPTGMGAPLFNNPRMQGYNGPLFNNPNVNLAGLNQLQGMGDDNEDGNFPAP